MKDLEKNLVNNEFIITQTKLHWVFFCNTCLSYLLSLMMIVAVFFANILEGVALFGISLEAYMVTILLIFTTLGMLDTILNYRAAVYIVTNHRVIIKRGWIVKNMRSIHLDKLESTATSQTFVAQFFNYGNVILRGVGGGDYYLTMIPDAETFSSTIQSAIENSEDSKGE
jgi:uncharacterized membrane protein YdbT with pleckstrin-like domain